MKKDKIINKSKKITPRHKNWFIFQMLKLNTNFLGDEYRVKKKYDLLSVKEQLKNEDRDIVLSVNEFGKKIGLKKFNDFKKDIDKLIHVYGLGGQWFYFFIIYFVVGLKIYPDEMINKPSVEECKKNKKIVLEIDQNATLEDIKEEWKNIEKIKKEVWGEKIIKKIGLDAINSYALFLKDLRLRGKKIDGKKLTDKEKVAYVWEDFDEDVDFAELDKKRANKLKQNRKRFQEKIEDMDLGRIFGDN